jgi:uncharacterized protein YecT (DUF1311 family)
MYVDLILPRLGREILQRAGCAVISVLAPTANVPAHAATAFIDGEATYLERILPPSDSTLVVTLQDTSRADAPAIERASTSLRLGSGPPYAWRLVYDISLGDPQRLTVRARIITPAGLWMTTDTVVSALGGPSPLSLRLVSAGAQAPAKAFAGAATQVDMNRCVHEDFEEAGSGYAQRFRELSQLLPAAQRGRLRRMQGAWLKFRTEACRYESGSVTGGSVQKFVYWRCATRMTRERTLALQVMAVCREGDITCSSRLP